MERIQVDRCVADRGTNFCWGTEGTGQRALRARLEFKVVQHMPITTCIEILRMSPGGRVGGLELGPEVVRLFSEN